MVDCLLYVSAGNEAEFWSQVKSIELLDIDGEFVNTYYMLSEHELHKISAKVVLLAPQ